MSTTAPTTHTLKDGRTVTIRSAVAADAVQLLEHQKRIFIDNEFAGREADEINPSVEERASKIEEHVQDQGKLWLVAEHEGTIIGMINFKNGDARRTAHVGIFGIGMDHGWRGLGLGTLLLDCLLQWAEEEPSIEKVALGVFSSNEWAIRLYKKFGFIEEGRRHRAIKFGPGRYVDDVAMYKWVKKEED